MAKHPKLSAIAGAYEKASKKPKAPKAAPAEGSPAEEAMESPMEEQTEDSAMPKRPMTSKKSMKQKSPMPKKGFQG